MGTGVQKEHAVLGDIPEFISGKKFNQTFNVTEQLGCDSFLKIWPSFYLYSTYVVWWQWWIKRESSVTFNLRVFLGL